MHYLDYFRKAFWGTVIVLLVILCLAGCSEADAKAETIPARFTVEKVSELTAGSVIISDAETDTQYLFVKSGYGAGMVKLEKVESTPVGYELTDHERGMIEALIMAEAGHDTYLSQMAVAQCLRNACEKSGLRPPEAALEYKYTSNRMEPSESVQEAVAAVFDRGEDAVADEILWFYAPKYVSGTPWHETQRLVCEIGNHKFFAEG